ncbi:MAG: SRPBCC domain-containing protein [Bacteriovoracales bacterium]
MPNILHRVGIHISPEKVYKAISSPDGLSNWWLTGTIGENRVGGILHFSPKGGSFKMKITDLKPRKRVKWKCVEGPKEWVGTEICYDLKYKDKQTFVLFTHAKWKKESEFMHHCSTKWATFLLSLKYLLERDEGRPHPFDVKISIDD